MVSTSHRVGFSGALPERSGPRKRRVRSDEDPAVAEKPCVAGGWVWEEGEEHC